MAGRATGCVRTSGVEKTRRQEGRAWLPRAVGVTGWVWRGGEEWGGEGGEEWCLGAAGSARKGGGSLLVVLLHWAWG